MIDKNAVCHLIRIVAHLLLLIMFVSFKAIKPSILDCILCFEESLLTEKYKYTPVDLPVHPSCLHRAYKAKAFN